MMLLKAIISELISYYDSKDYSIALKAVVAKDSGNFACTTALFPLVMWTLRLVVVIN